MIDLDNFEGFLSYRNSHSIPGPGSSTRSTEGLNIQMLIDNQTKKVKHKNGDLTLMATVDGSPISVRFWKKSRRDRLKKTTF